MADMRYFSMNGEVPFGGMPPVYIMAASQQGLPPGTPAPGPPQLIPIFPRPDLGIIPGWQPWQEPPGVIPPPYSAPPPPPPPARPVASASSSAAPPLPPGGNIPGTKQPLVTASGQGYIFPKNHTTLHIIESNFPPWDKPGGTFFWRSVLAPPTLTLKELIEQVAPETGPKGEKATSRGITECLESGDGVWLKASEFWIGEKGDNDAMKKKVGQALAKVGWDEGRGTTSRPVWLAVAVVY
ncbi:predicted protein [Uncinocarpus reesii 1704]|uniref:Uncharacterized protein n=1 Tax=Uncinocarpus reesii (strain UAMH 1704) TaxID=336963 RepID=C4JWC0_UNCRE|nr:uncharacterized protein UREG_06862 [Uncinocarpus reesii 1704]EEP81997.1 predicted protein [Uncinocarpus reesii 1704]